MNINAKIVLFMNYADVEQLQMRVDPKVPEITWQ